MDNTEITLSIISAAISLAAVITAICLSIIPEMRKSRNQRKMSRNKIRHVFEIINLFFEEYRFYNTTKSIINKKVLLGFDVEGLKYKIDIIALLESIKEDIVYAKYSDQEKLSILESSLKCERNTPESLTRCQVA